MSKVAPMSKETESKLTQLLMEVVDSGSEPVAELTKIAKDAQLTPEQIRLLGRAYNTGVTLGQLKEGSTIQEKAAIVSLVDPEEVVKNLYPDTVETPAAQNCKTAVSSDYNSPPAVTTKPKKLYNNTLFQKAASETKPTADLGSEGINKYANKQERKRILDEARRIIDENVHKTAQAFDNLRDYFERAGCQPFQYIYKTASTVYGEIAENILNHIAINLKHTKFAVFRQEPANWNKPPYNYIKTAIESIHQHNLYKEKIDKIDEVLAKEANKKKVAKETINGSVIDYLEKTSAVFGGVAGGAGYGAGRAIIDRFKPVPEHEEIRKHIRKLDAGGHAANLQRIRTQTLLTELMLSDPVVSEHTPHDVFEAFNYLNEVAPRALQHPLMAKSLIRKYLEQGNTLDTFDAAQLTQMEKELTRHTAPAVTAEFDLLQPDRKPQREHEDE